jgi:hypothetical protein
MAMGLDGFWWFYKLTENGFSQVQPEFNKARIGVRPVPVVPKLLPQPKPPFLTKEQVEAILGGILIGRDLSWNLFHQPFHDIAYQILKEGVPLSIENYVESIMQSRVLPPAILLAGVGSQKFSQLPGYFGNMLIHPNDVEETLQSILQILNIDWGSYVERTKVVLGYTTFDDCEATQVADILEVIPKALEIVQSERCGLLALTSWGCP